MQEDESNTNVNEEVVDENPVADDTQTEQLAQDTEPEQEQSAPQEEVVEEDVPEVREEAKSEEPAPSRREQLRIQNLLKKYGNPDTPKQAPFQRPDALNYQEALDADPEVIQQLEADRQATGQSQYNEGLKRAEYLNWNTSLKIDAPQIESKYPVLDPKSPEFHPAAADAINQWYLNMSGFDNTTQTVNNPNIGYAEFVEGFMELVQETAGQKNAQTVKNVAKQAATTGLRPDGSSAKRLDLTKEPQKMSMEELYAAIGQKYQK